MRIAMIGSRGVPARAGGVERHVEELGARLSERGHDVVVHCRSSYAHSTATRYRGMTLRTMPTPRRGGIEALAHSGLAATASLWGHFDVVHYHALGPGIFAPLTRAASGSAVVLTVHGLDDERAKWGPAGRRVLRTGRWLSTWCPDATVVVSKDLQRTYAELHGRLTDYISNGLPPHAEFAGGLLAGFGLEEDGYAVFVGRLVPEKDPGLLIEAYRDVPGTMPLVIVGESSHTDKYVGHLRRLAASDPRVRFVGHRDGAELAALRAGARVFVQPSRLEGLPLSLLEAIADDVPVLASDIPPHREVLSGMAEAGTFLTFRAGDRGALAEALITALGADPVAARGRARDLHGRAAARYDWETATDLLEHAYARAVIAAARRHHRPETRPAVVAQPL